PEQARASAAGREYGDGHGPIGGSATGSPARSATGSVPGGAAREPRGDVDERPAHDDHPGRVRPAEPARAHDEPVRLPGELDRDVVREPDAEEVEQVVPERRGPRREPDPGVEVDRVDAHLAPPGDQ